MAELLPASPPSCQPSGHWSTWIIEIRPQKDADGARSMVLCRQLEIAHQAELLLSSMANALTLLFSKTDP